MSFLIDPGSTTDPWGERLDRIGLFGAHLFALFALLGISVAVLGLFLFLLAFLLRFRYWRLLSRESMAILCFLLVLYLALHSLTFYLIAPTDAMARDVLEAGGNWAKFVLLVPFAYWVGGDPNRIGRLLLLALLGFTLGFLRKIEWSTVDIDFFRTRFEHYLPGNAFGMFAALGTLGLISMRERFWGDGRGRQPRWTRMLLWCLLLAIMVEGLILSFSRGSWLAFLVAAVLLLWLELRRLVDRRAHAGGKGRTAIPLFLGALFVFLVAAYWDQIHVRVIGEGPVVARVLDGNLDGLQHSSVGIRLLGWRYGIQEWRWHPWFGLGAGTSRHRIAASDHTELRMYDKFWLPHLHNTYLEILYQLGLVGLILLAAVIWVLARGVAAEYRAGRIPRDLCRFLLATLVFVLVWNLFEYRAVRHDWRFFWIIFAGSAYSFHLRTLLRGARPPLDGSGREAQS